MPKYRDILKNFQSSEEESKIYIALPLLWFIILTTILITTNNSRLLELCQLRLLAIHFDKVIGDLECFFTPCDSLLVISLESNRFHQTLASNLIISIYSVLQKFLSEMKLGLALTVCLFVFESSSAELAKSPPAEENLPSYEGMFL